MFILQSKESLGNAIKNAKALHPKVTPVRFGEYNVTGSRGNNYTVRCYRENGNKIVDCNCKAGKVGMACKHSAAALPLHIHLAARRTQNTAAH